MGYITLDLENLEKEHVCCAISDKKHQCGVDVKKEWLRERIPEGHIFRKLDARGKVFIECAPLEKAWVPINGENYMYIYCLWVSGSFKGNGYGKGLLESCIKDAKEKGKEGICVLSSKKKTPFLSDKKFFVKNGFEVVDRVEQYELLALSFTDRKPSFNETVRKGEIENKEITFYYGVQCPYIPNCILQVEKYLKENKIPFSFYPVDSLKIAKELPCVFNNWAVFYKGKFETVHLLNEGYLKKMLARDQSIE
jgi:N-acetylglutamate synthase-like GNAT family acetyltransferase